MIPCEVVNANNTGKPCPNPGTETAELVYPSGVSETKRCCPEHAAMVEKASTAARSILAARAAARRDQSDARAARVAAARRLERPPADPVPPVTPVEEIPTMPESKNPVEPERGQPAPKPIRSAFVVVRRCRWCDSVGKFPFCLTCSDRLRSLRAWPDIGTVLDGFDAKTSPLEPVIDAWARKCEQARANRRRPNGQRSKKLVEPVEPDEDKHRAEALLAAAVENGETTDAAPAAPAEPVANVVPPKVGDRWGDLTPEQKALVLDGSLLYFAEDRETCEKQHGSWPYEVMHDDNVIVRLGPAPTATPEPDRSGWPVLVKQKFHDGGTVYRMAGSFDAPAVWPGDDGEWYSTLGNGSLGTEYQTALEAADAIRHRLPDEVSEAARTVPEAIEIERDASASAIDAIVRLGHTEHCAKRLAWGDGECECRGADPRDAEIATLREQVEAFRRAACVATGRGEDTTPGDATLIQTLRRAAPHALRTVVREAMEACDRAGVHEGLTPAERIETLARCRTKDRDTLESAWEASRANTERLRRAIADVLDIEGQVPPDDELVRRLRDPRATDIKTLRERAESAEATLDAYRIQRDQAREDAAGLRRLLNDAAALRAAAAEACDCDDGEEPADAELARRLRELAREPHDFALVRRVVGIQTAALRKLTSENPTFSDIAIALAADTIDAVVGVRP